MTFGQTNSGGGNGEIGPLLASEILNIKIFLEFIMSYIIFFVIVKKKIKSIDNFENLKT